MNLTEREQQLRDALRNEDHDQAQTIGAALDAEQRERDARLEAPGALLNAALWYAAQGVPVFPCRRRGKSTAIKTAHEDPVEQQKCKRACGRDGHGLYDATTDPARIRAWWKQYPQANIGAPTGHHFDVIDVDGPEGLARALYMDLPPLIGKTRTSRPGGWHYYIAPTGRGCRNDAFPHIDFKGRGGYVILPPSVGENGNRYRWTQPLTTTIAETGAA